MMTFMTVRDNTGPRPRRKQTPRFLLEEIIGKQVRVARSSCKDLAGTEGKILDETKNTLLLQTGKGRKRIPKSSCDFLFVEEGVEVPGRLFAVRPEERTKKLSRKK